MADLPETIYATFAGQINEASLQKLFLALATATTGGVKRIHMLFQSSGGFVADGVALYSAFRGFPLELSLYNTGSVQSIGVIAFLGCRNRYVSKFGTFMIHKSHLSPQTAEVATKFLAMATQLITEDKRIEAIIREETAIPEDRWTAHSTQNVFFNAAEAVQFGLATAEREWQVPAGEKIFNLI